MEDENKFIDIRNLIFTGYLKETVRFEKLIIVIRTLSLSEENFVIETYENLPDVYNILAAADTIKKVIYSINGCKINDDCRMIVDDWPKQVIIKLFDVYLALSNRAREAIKIIDDFIKTNESKLHWSVIKSTKTSLNSAIITGNPEFELRGLSYPQRVWIYLNQQEDVIAQNKLEWSKVEYMTEYICSFINPKAMKQIQHKRELELEEVEREEELQKIQNDNKEKTMIENTADDLFDSLSKRKNETATEYKNRVAKALEKAWEEDEHDKLIREYEEYEFAKKLRIQKENGRRSKLLFEQRKTNAVVIEMPEENDSISVGFHQVATIGDDDQFTELILDQQKGNPYYINNINYAEILEITSYSMLKNKEKIFQEVIAESDEETIKWIEKYIDEEKNQGDISKQLGEISKESLATSTSGKDALLNRRERLVSRNKFESQQDEMIQQIQKEQDEIQFRRN